LGAINWFTQRLPQQDFNTLAISFQNTTNDLSTLYLEPPTHFNNFFGYPQCTDAISCPNTAFETLPRQEHLNQRITFQPVVILIIIVFGRCFVFCVDFPAKKHHGQKVLYKNCSILQLAFLNAMYVVIITKFITKLLKSSREK